MNDLKTAVKEMIVERLFLRVSPEEIGDDVPLMETYGVDSVALFEIVIGLEEKFGIPMEDVDFRIDNFRTVDLIAAFVAGKQSA